VEFEKWNAFSRVAVSHYGDRRVITIDSGAATEVLSNAARQSGGIRSPTATRNAVAN